MHRIKSDNKKTPSHALLKFMIWSFHSVNPFFLILSHFVVQGRKISTRDRAIA